MSSLEMIKQNILDGDEEAIRKSVLKAIEENVDISDILNKGLIDTMALVGELWKQDEIFTPEVLVSASTMKIGVDILKPILEEKGVKPIGKIVLGTVKHDIHDIGKNLVGMMFTGAGFEVIDIGIDVSEAKFVEAVKKYEPNILALSALLTTTIGELEIVINSLKKANIRDKVKVMIRGAPVTQELADKIGADGFAEDAATAAQKAREILKQ